MKIVRNNEALAFVLGIIVGMIILGVGLHQKPNNDLPADASICDNERC